MSQTLGKVMLYINSHRARTARSLEAQREEHRIVRQQVKGYMDDFVARKHLKRAIWDIHENMIIEESVRKKFYDVQARLQNQIKALFKVEDKEMKTSFYGLTAVGIQFINSTVKFEVRMRNVVEKIKPLFEKVKADLEKGKYEPLISDPSNEFIVRFAKEDRYLYLQLVRSDLGKKVEGLIFKVRFQHLESRKESKLAILLKKYMDFDRERVKKVATAFLFLLKVNCLVGSKQGYLNSMAYLMMFINYC